MAESIWGTSDASSYAPTSTGYPAVQNLAAQKYLVAPGNIDLSNRQIIDNPENPQEPDPREYGSEYSSRSQLPSGHWMSYPTIYDGQTHSPSDGYKHAVKSGMHLGIYAPNTPDKVLDEVENALHSRPIKVNGKLLTGDAWAAMKKRKISDVVKR